MTMNYQKELFVLMVISIIYSKLNNFRDVQNPNQDKASMNMALNEFKYLTSSCWNEKYHPLTLI